MTVSRESYYWSTFMKLTRYISETVWKTERAFILSPIKKVIRKRSGTDLSVFEKTGAIDVSKL